jgi:transcriptional regulator with AAA-type ATPase domain
MSRYTAHRPTVPLSRASSRVLVRACGIVRSNVVNDDLDTHESIGMEQPQGSADQRCVVILWSQNEAYQGEQVPLTGDLPIGRVHDGGRGLMLDDRRVSRKHAVLTSDGLLRDLGSTNGTYINGTRIDSQRLTVGDVFRVGDTLLLLTFVGAALNEPFTGELTTRSQVLRQVLVELDRVASHDLPILIQGETGTGKELVARRVHWASGRSGPFVAVNCAAFSENLIESALFGHKKGAFTGAARDEPGYFAQAQNGTLFLDEIGDLPVQLQPKLLRALESHEFTPVGTTAAAATNARIVAATNANLLAEIDAGTFRSDLYARLSGYVTRLPPLRARRCDVVLLAQRFNAEFGGKLTFSTRVMEKFVVYNWPRNVRELRFVIQRLAAVCEAGVPVDLKHLEGTLLERRGAPAEESVAKKHRGQQPPKEELLELLARYGGNVAQIAEHYGKERRQIYRWLQAHGLDAQAFRDQ